MRDFERDPLKRPVNALPAQPTHDGHAHEHPTSPARHPALDVASVMRLQRMVGNQGVVQMLAGDEERSPVHDVVGSGGGTPLDAGTRGTMESAFGTSFEGVRVHTDDQASKSAESVGANAYTVGSDVVFRSGHYDPGTPTGQRTIAHELSHVVQQSQGSVDGTAASGGIKVSDPSDRFEQAADHRADQVMSSVSATSASAPAPASASLSSSGGSVQREDEAVQREADGATLLPALQREDEEAPPEDEQPG